MSPESADLHDRDDNSKRDDRDDNYGSDDRPDYEERHRGTMILVLGILGLVMCPMIGIAAWLMGSADLRAMDERRMDPEGRQLTQVGKILGIVASILFVLQMSLLLLYVIGIGVFFALKK